MTASKAPRPFGPRVLTVSEQKLGLEALVHHAPGRQPLHFIISTICASHSEGSSFHAGDQLYHHIFHENSYTLHVPSQVQSLSASRLSLTAIPQDPSS